MRQEMSKTNEKDAKKVDKEQYKDLMNKEAQSHKDFIETTKAGGNNTQAKQESSGPKEAWRKGDQEKAAQEKLIFE